MSRAAVEVERPGVSRTMKRGETIRIAGVEISLLDVQGNKARLRVQAQDGTGDRDKRMALTNFNGPISQGGFGPISHPVGGGLEWPEVADLYYDESVHDEGDLRALEEAMAEPGPSITVDELSRRLGIE